MPRRATDEQIKKNALKRNKRYYDKQEKGFRNNYQKDYWLKHPQKQLWLSARSRAKTRSLEFTISEQDIIIPEFCPLLNIRLERGTKLNHDCSPSLDRIDVSKGYIPGNIAVISYKANRYKNDMSLELIEKLYKYALLKS